MNLKSIQNGNEVIRATSLLLLAFGLFACQPPAIITGKISGELPENIRIYLLEPASLDAVAGSYLAKVIDSAQIDSDGGFAFQNPPKTKEAVLLELAVQPSGMAPNYLQTDDPESANYMPLVWQSGESLRITARIDQFQKSFAIEQPSALNQALLDLRDLRAEAYQKYLAGKEWELEEGRQLLEKEQALLHYQQQLMEFANSTPYLLPALVALRWVSPDNSYEKLPEFLVAQCTKWKETQAAHPWVNQLCEEADPDALPVLLGAQFPNLRLPLLGGDTLPLYQLLGQQLTIIDLWASWCGPCRKENREVLGPVWEEYHQRGLQIIGIGLESDAATWKAAVVQDGANRWHQSSHLQGDAEPLYKEMRVWTIPSNFIVDHQGVVVAKNVHGNALIDLVKNHLEKK